MRFSSLLGAVWIVLLPAAGFGQPTSPAGSRGESISAEVGVSFGGELSDNASRRFADVNVTHHGIAAAQSIPLRPTTRLALELTFDRYQFDLDRRFVPLPDAVQSWALQATVRQQLNERWSLVGSVAPGFQNADDAFDANGFAINARAVALYKKSEVLTWGFGLIYRSLTEADYRVLPAFGFDWHPDRTWTVAVGFPRTALTYAASDRLRFSCGATAQGGTFYVKDRVGAALSSLPPLSDTLVDYTEIRVGVRIDYQLARGLELFASVGAIVHQKFDYFERGYDLKAGRGAPFCSLGAKQSF